MHARPRVEGCKRAMPRKKPAGSTPKNSSAKSTGSVAKKPPRKKAASHRAKGPIAPAPSSAAKGGGAKDAAPPPARQPEEALQAARVHALSLQEELYSIGANELANTLHFLKLERPSEEDVSFLRDARASAARRRPPLEVRLEDALRTVARCDLPVLKAQMKGLEEALLLMGAEPLAAKENPYRKFKDLTWEGVRDGSAFSTRRLCDMGACFRRDCVSFVQQATSRALGIVHKGEVSRDCVQRAALAYVQTDGHQWLEARAREAHEVKTLLDMQMEIRGIFDDRRLWRRV